jgi:tetratricopeptide (TPR) repeat protein
MTSVAHVLLTVLLVPVLPVPMPGNVLGEDLSQPYKPLHPPTKKELNHREAMKQYAVGLVCLQEDRLVEALEAFEKAARLDPQAPEAQRALIPLYVGLNRAKDALAVCQKVLDIDAEDPATWYNYSRLLYNDGQSKEARTALEKGLQHVSEEDEPRLAEQILFDLGQLQTEEKQTGAAAKSFAHCAHLMELALETETLEPEALQEITLKIADLYERIGKLHDEAHHYADALEAYQKAQKIHPEGAARWDLALARLHEARGETKQALAHANAYLALQPQGLEAYRLKIQLLEKLHHNEEILPWLEQAAGRDRFNVGLHRLLARHYARSGQPARSEKMYLELAKDNPQPEIYQDLFHMYEDVPSFGMAHVLAQLNKTILGTKKGQPGEEAARAQARGMIGALRQDKDLAARLVDTALVQLDKQHDLAPETRQLLATLADENDKTAGAERFYRSCLPDLTPDAEVLVYTGLLRDLWKEKKFDEIIKVCRDAVGKTQPANQILFHSEMARALARLNKIDQALAEADASLKLASDRTRLPMLSLRIRILSQGERYEQAEKECLNLLKELKLPSETAEIHYLLSSIYTAARNFPKAEEELQLILQADPANATAHNDLGYLWADQGKNLPEAERLIRKALELDRSQRAGPLNTGKEADQDHAAFVDSLGWVLFRKGDVKGARVELEKAIHLPGGEDPVIWDHLGDVHQQQHHARQARRCWEKALELYEADHIRSRDQRYEELKVKLKQLSKTQP